LSSGGIRNNGFSDRGVCHFLPGKNSSGRESIERCRNLSILAFVTPAAAVKAPAEDMPATISIAVQYAGHGSSGDVNTTSGEYRNDKKRLIGKISEHLPAALFSRFPAAGRRDRRGKGLPNGLG